VLERAGAIRCTGGDRSRLDDASLLERIPDTVQALIAARIDRLAADEKRVLQSAALVGRVFWRSALDRLAPTSTWLPSSTRCSRVIRRP
jgi:hypothetical protein